MTRPAVDRPQARDTIAQSLARFPLVAPRPRRGDGTSWPTDVATSVMHALTAAGFLVVHQDAMPAAVLDAVAGYQDSP